ncbi:MAG: hypothetical protein SGILL_009096, partial [Bacillariaceae sp.]
IFKTKLRWGRKKFIPLNIPGFVNNGVCVHPQCDPPKKLSPDYSRNSDTDVTVSNEVDSLLDAVEENRNDIEKFYHEMQKADDENKEMAAVMLEEAVMQLNRSMSHLSKDQEAKLLSVKHELCQEIDVAQAAINSLDNRVSEIEGMMTTMKLKIHDLQDGSARHDIEHKELRAELEELRARFESSDLGSSGAIPVPAPCKPVVEAEIFLSTVADTKPKDFLQDFPLKHRFKCSQTLQNNQNGVMCCASVDDGMFLAYGGNSNYLNIVRQQVDGSYDIHNPQVLEDHREWIMQVP